MLKARDLLERALSALGVIQQSKSNIPVMPALLFEHDAAVTEAAYQRRFECPRVVIPNNTNSLR